MEQTICSWVKIDNPLDLAYHNQEWGRPIKDDQLLFELLCLESYQAGLSWSTVLHKREAFRKAFHGYDVQKVAMMTDTDLDVLLTNPDLIPFYRLQALSMTTKTLVSISR